MDFYILHKFEIEIILINCYNSTPNNEFCAKEANMVFLQGRMKLRDKVRLTLYCVRVTILYTDININGFCKVNLLV